MSWRPDYITLPDLKAYVRVQDTVDDAVLGVCISAASRAIDRETRRQFGQNNPAVARIYEIPCGRQSLESKMIVDTDDLMDVTGMVVTYQEVDVTADVRPWPLNSIVDGVPYTAVQVPGYYLDELTITALWGWTQVPAAIIQATTILAGRLYTRRDAPFGIIGTSEAGDTAYVPRIDPDVAMMVRAFYRWW
jgi:hypothetical protein